MKLFTRIFASIVAAFALAMTPIKASEYIPHHISKEVARAYGFDRLKRDAHGDCMRRFFNATTIAFSNFLLLQTIWISRKSPNPMKKFLQGDFPVAAMLIAAIWVATRIPIMLRTRGSQRPKRLLTLLEKSYLKIRQDLVSQKNISRETELEAEHIMQVMQELADVPQTTPVQSRKLLSYVTQLQNLDALKQSIIESPGTESKIILGSSESYDQLFDATYYEELPSVTKVDIAEMIPNNRGKQIKTLAYGLAIAGFLAPFSIDCSRYTGQFICYASFLSGWALDEALRKFSVASVYNHLAFQEAQLEKYLRRGGELTDELRNRAQDLAELYTEFCEHKHTPLQLAQDLKPQIAHLITLAGDIKDQSLAQEVDSSLPARQDDLDTVDQSEHNSSDDVVSAS